MHLNSELSRLGRKGERRKRGERKRREGTRDKNNMGATEAQGNTRAAPEGAEGASVTHEIQLCSLRGL